MRRWIGIKKNLIFQVAFLLSACGPLRAEVIRGPAELRSGETGFLAYVDPAYLDIMNRAD